MFIYTTTIILVAWQELIDIVYLGWGTMRARELGSWFRVHSALRLHPGPIHNPALGRENVLGVGMN
jgi:hypothetical protein